MKKRILTLLTTAIVFITLLLPVQALGTALTVSTVTVKTGAETTSVSVPIILSGNTGICGMIFNISYDNELTLTDLTQGSALTSLDYSKPKDLSANPLKVMWDGVENDTSNGEIIFLTFDVPTANPGSYDISLSYDTGDIYDGDLNDVPVALNAGRIIVKNIETVDVGLLTINGAQIRTTGNQGLRFISSIDKTTVDFDRVVEYGTVLIPTADLTDISELVIGATLNGHAVAKVAAKNLYEVTDSTITFTAVLTNIKEKNYAREYTARAYAILDDGSVVYADSGASRSIYTVAKRGLENSAETEANKAVFQAIVDAVETV